MGTIKPLIVWLTMSVVFVQAGYAQSGDAAAAPPPAVMVQTVGESEITESVTFSGRVEAVDKVELIARVQGFLESVNVEEGAEVNQGDTLFVIEKEPYEIAVAQARSSLASAQATEKLARVTFNRNEDLAERNTVSQADLDKARADLTSAQAAIQVEQAELDKAMLNLGYTDIKAPMAGRIGAIAYSQGALVGPESGSLVTLVSQDPMQVAFAVSQRVLLDVRQRSEQPVNAVVKVELADGSIYPHSGTILFADVEANPTTDTVTVYASVPNPEHLLVDQQLLRIIVEASQSERKLVVSQAAMLVDQQGSYVLAVTAANEVEARRIEVGDQEGSEIVVLSGLSDGDRVIVSGIQKVRPGMVVDAQEVQQQVSGSGETDQDGDDPDATGTQQ